MGTETRLAFSHPEARAAATAHDLPQDRISLRDHVVTADIGAFQPERGRRQRLCFNVVVEVSSAGAGADDDVDRILSYDTLTDAIAAALGEERLNLLETLAERVAARILSEPRALRCFVRVEKLDLGPGALGVEIVRAAPVTPAIPTVSDAPQPVILHLSGAAWDWPRLDHLIAAAAAAGPAILTVDLPAGPRPAAAHRLAQRRIDLLAIEQNCWRLAAIAPHCSVVETRTELDWALRKGVTTIWAPSKLVLDAVDPPQGDAVDGAALAGWFAGQMGARALWIAGGVGGDPVSAVPVHHVSAP